MEYRHLGKSGLKISVFSYGSWLTLGTKVDEKMVEICMKSAYEKGIYFLITLGHMLMAYLKLSWGMS